MKKNYKQPATIVVPIATRDGILQETSNMGLDTGTVIGGEIDDDNKLVKKNHGGNWDMDWDE